MKRLCANRIIFICIAFFTLINLFSEGLITSLWSASCQFLRNGDMEGLVENIDDSVKEMRYKNLFIDLQSWKYRLTGVRKVEKEDSVVLRLSNDYLCYDKEDLSPELIETAANACIELKEETEKFQIPFLYVYAPSKLYYNTQKPEYRKDCDTFLDLLKQGDVEVLNLAEEMETNHISMEDAYFITDHHWKAETAFWAYTQICEKLHNRYGFQYDKEKTSLSNYNIKVYKDWFLGSQGKKTGRYFTPLGVDDISLITPDFETNFTVTSNQTKETGSFDDTLIQMHHIEEKDYYSKRSYQVYTGGDYQVQVIENHLAENDQKILLIRDSFACAVSPFLSLNAKSVHCLDIRRKNQENENVSHVYDYIKEYNPDYVVVLYSELDITEDDMSKYEFR